MGMCRRSGPARSIFCRKATKTATPPKGVTARLVSRRISRSLDSRAAISRGTDLSAVLVSIPLLSQTLTVDAQPNLGNEDKGIRIAPGGLARSVAYSEGPLAYNTRIKV